MPFKVRNLMVSVLPEGTEIQQANLQTQWTGTIYTTTWTTTWTTWPTTWPTNCFGNTCGLSRPPTIVTYYCTYACTGPIDFSDIEVLNQLKVQLDAQIAAVNANLAPKTLEEADMLEKHLTEALNEVKATKDALRKASK